MTLFVNIPNDKEVQNWKSFSWSFMEMDCNPTVRLTTASTFCHLSWSRYLHSHFLYKVLGLWRKLKWQIFEVEIQNFKVLISFHLNLQNMQQLQQAATLNTSFLFRVYSSTDDSNVQALALNLTFMSFKLRKILFIHGHVDTNIKSANFQGKSRRKKKIKRMCELYRCHECLIKRNFLFAADDRNDIKSKVLVNRNFW